MRREEMERDRGARRDGWKGRNQGNEKRKEGSERRDT